MTPYFESDGIVLYHGSCLDILPRLPADSVDLIVTDPPYGAEWQSGHRQAKFAVMAGDQDQTVARAGVAAALRCLCNGRHIYVFGPSVLEGLPVQTPVELIWDKGQFAGGDTASAWAISHERIEFAGYYGSVVNRMDGYGRLAARLRRGSVLRYPRLHSQAVTRHPTEKPVGLLRELIESSSCFGETVLDPFAGSGSTLVAARLEGRKAIGIEIDERYCTVAAKRLAQMVMPFEEAP